MRATTMVVEVLLLILMGNNLWEILLLRMEPKTIILIQWLWRM
jgi:hypothetical protein